MKTHTNDYKNKIKLLGRQIDSKITYTVGSEIIELGVKDLNSVTPHFEGSILKSVMKCLEIDSNEDIPLETEINYQFGIKIDNYTITSDVTYLAGKTYYSKIDNIYVMLIEGTDYTVGETITDDVYELTENYEYIDFGNYIVFSSEKLEDTRSYKIICYDKMLYAMKDYESLGVTYPITITNYISALCSHLGLTFKNTSDTFANYNRQIDHELFLASNGDTLGYTFRDVLDELAEVTASTICINEQDDELEIRYINNTGDTISSEFLKDVNVNFGEKFGPVNSIVLSRSANTDNIYLNDDESIAQNGLCEIKIKDNQIMNFNDRSDYLPDILRKLDGLEYYLNDFSSTGITYYNLCDKYNIVVGEETYSCIMFNDEILITQGLEENIHTEAPIQNETDYTKADKTDRKINQTYIIVDKQNQTIESVVSNVTEQDSKISSIEQTVNELNSKISDIADITISGESYEATLTLNNINASEPIRVEIRPTSNQDFRCIYPYSGLYPSSSLYTKTRKLRFENTTTNENFDYIIPYDLYYYDGDNYDSFVLDYDSQTCYVYKKVTLDANNNKILLQTPQTISIPYPAINLTDGDYNITLLGYTDIYLFVRLMAQNIYTTQFATRAEMNSAITQTASEINLEVAKKVNSDEIISSINLTPETATINANKISLAGKQINLTSDDIAIASNHFNVDTNGNLSCSNATVSGTINGSNINGSVINGGSIELNTDTFAQGIYIHSANNNAYTRIRSGYITLGKNDTDNLQLSPTGLGMFDTVTARTELQVGLNGLLRCYGNATIQGNLTVSGTKNRAVDIKDKKVLLNAYETASPYFGDIGSDATNENGYCKIYIDDIFKQTIEPDDYKVFIQECGDGHLYVEKHDNYFEVKGTPSLNFDWEIKAIQKGYSNVRLEELKNEK